MKTTRLIFSLLLLATGQQLYLIRPGRRARQHSGNSYFRFE